MRITVISRFRAGSLFAHAINTVKMAQGFAERGHAVTVICRRGEAGVVDEQELAGVYGLRRSLHWVQVGPKWGGGRPGVDWRFLRAVAPRVWRSRPELVYARDFVAPTWTSGRGYRTVVESHAHPGSENARMLQMVRATGREALRGWVTISPRLAEHYEGLGVPAEKLWVLPDAVDLPQFARPATLPADPYPAGQPRVTYAGHLYDYKGVPTILNTAARLPGVAFHLVGGWPDDVARQRAAVEARGLTNVTLHGWIPQAELPPYLWHADVLLLPPSAEHPSAAWTSPVKLGEYLASRTPVVSAEIPALRDWLDESQTRWFTPDDPAALAAAIDQLLGDPNRRAALAEAGWRRVQSLTYERRAAAVLARAGASGSVGHGASTDRGGGDITFR